MPAVTATPPGPGMHTGAQARVACGGLGLRLARPRTRGCSVDNDMQSTRNASSHADVAHAVLMDGFVSLIRLMACRERRSRTCSPQSIQVHPRRTDGCRGTVETRDLVLAYPQRLASSRPAIPPSWWRVPSLHGFVLRGGDASSNTAHAGSAAHTSCSFAATSRSYNCTLEPRNCSGCRAASASRRPRGRRRRTRRPLQRQAVGRGSGAARADSRPAIRR